jgi:hypothetical protein
VNVLFLIPAALIVWFGLKYLTRFATAVGPALIGWVLLVGALFHAFFVFFGPWSKEEAGDGVFSSTGGAGFGVIGAILAVVLLVLCLVRVTGRRGLLPGFGVDQASLAVALGAFLNLLAYFAEDRRAVGWGAAWAWVPPYLMLQLVVVSLAGAEPVRARALNSSQQRALGIGAVAVGGLVALLPFLNWVEVSAEDTTTTLTGYEPTGPHMSYFLAIIGVGVAIAGLMRLRPQGLAEPGHLLTIGHVFTVLGVSATLLPLGYLLFAGQTDGLAPQVGVILNLIAGIGMLALGWSELRMRRAGAA